MSRENEYLIEIDEGRTGVGEYKSLLSYDNENVPGRVYAFSEEKALREARRKYGNRIIGNSEGDYNTSVTLVGPVKPGKHESKGKTVRHAISDLVEKAIKDTEFDIMGTHEKMNIIDITNYIENRWKNNDGVRIELVDRQIALFG
jgi:hypothetical protein